MTTAKHNAPVKVVIADLESKYQEIEQETNQAQFFIKIAQYGNYILENKTTTEVLSALYQEAKNDANIYLKAWEDFIRTWKQYAKDLLKKAQQAGIKDNPQNPLFNEIASIKSNLKEKDTSVWETDLGSFYLPYQTLIWKFKDVNKNDLLIPKHIEPEDNTIVIYPFYNKARDEWDKFKYSREAKVWWAHYQICRLAAGVLDLKIETDYFKKDNIIDGFYKFEFKEVAKGNINHSPIVLHKEKYSVWIKRLHKHLIPRLQVASNSIVKKRTTDYSDTAARRGLEKKWSILQAIWSVYESSSRADAIAIPIKRLPFKGRDLEEYDGVFEGLKREKLFGSWNRKERHYFVGEINHDRFEGYYENTKELHKKFASEHKQSKNQKSVATLKGKKIIFSEKESSIKTENESCVLPPYRNEYDLCKIMFSYKVGEPADWSAVFTKMTGDDDFEGKWRVVYDTLRRINDRIKKQFKTKDELFGWQNKTIKRNF